MNINRVMLIFLFCVNILTLGLYFFGNTNRDSAYINVSNVYDEFAMTKEYRSRLDSLKTLRKNLIDSLVFEISGLRREYEASPNDMLHEIIDKKISDLKAKNEFFNEDNEEVSRKYKLEILNQLNSYIKEFGDHIQIEMIFGATNDGSIMYASTDKDFTDKAIEFINQKYEDSPDTHVD